MSKQGTIQVPAEGLKVVTIAGFINGKPIWREIGRVVMNKNSTPLLLLDRCFNPAGPVVDSDSYYLMCPLKEFSDSELAVKREFTKPPAEKTPSPTFDDMDDDIPF